MSERPNQKKRTAKKSAKARVTDRRDAAEPASAERHRSAHDAREEGWRRYFARVGAEIREASERWRAEGLLVEFPDEEARLARLHQPLQRPINPERYKEAQRLQFASTIEHLRERGLWPPGERKFKRPDREELERIERAHMVKWLKENGHWPP